MKNTVVGCAALVVAALTACTVTAQEAAEGKLKTSLSAGVTLTDGNSETLQANSTLLTEGERARLGSVRAGIEANYGENRVKAAGEDGVTTDRNDTTIENARAFANAKKTLSPRYFTSVDGGVQYDKIAKIDYRAILAPGLGAYLLKNDSTTLSIEVGPAYIWEKVADVTDNYPAARAAQRLDHALSETAKIWQSAEFLPMADDFGDYLMNVEVGAEAALNSRMNLRLVLQNKHDSTPGAGLEKNDLTLIGGVSLSL